MAEGCGICGDDGAGVGPDGCGHMMCPRRMMRVCQGCNRRRPLAEFRRHNRSRDGYGRLCKDCRLRARYEREQAAAGQALPPFEQWVKNRYVRLGGAVPPRRNLTHRQLERLRRRGIIDDLEMDAGERYRMAWELSGIGPRLVADYGVRVGVGETTYGMPATESQARWRAQLREANAALGVFYQRVAERVCVEDATLLELARGLGFRGSRREAVRHATRVLHEALGILVDHYGLRRRDGGRRRGGAWHGKGAEVGVDPSCWERVEGNS